MRAVKVCGMVVGLCAVCWLGYWTAWATRDVPEYPTQREQAAAVARLEAAPKPVKGEKAEPVTFRHTIKPPRAAMAARTGVTMETAWSGTLEVLSQSDEPQWTYDGITSSVSIGGLGGAITIAKIGIELAHPHLSHPAPVEDWYGVYHKYSVTAGAPGDSDVAYAYVWVRDEFMPASGWGPLANPWPVLEGELTVAASINTTGLYLKRSRASNPPEDRSLMDWSDQSITDTWWADASTTVTATAEGDGLSVSATGDLGYSSEEVEIGETFYLVAAISLIKAPVADTVYGRISNVCWAGQAVSTGQVDLYKPGDNDDIPNADVAPGWSRTWTTNAAYHVSAGPTLEMSHLSGTTSAGAFNASQAVPYIVGWYPLDAKFDASGPAYDIEYTSNWVDWTYNEETEAWEQVLKTFTTNTAQVVSGWVSWLWQREWQRLSSNAIQVRVTEAFRTANNEDVPPVTPETQNDQRAAICTWGLTETDLSASPFWSSGFGFTLPASIDINDTQGLPARASPWVGGTGVTVDPGDNDLWTVAAGASAPAVTRTMATRYWLRMDRLASGYTPGLEYHPDWPIMLKANLDIGTTEDDPAWWTSVPAEDITNWANRRYVLLGITAPRAGNVTLTVAYSVPHPDDPCYTGAAYRWDEFSYTRSQYTLTYTVPVVAGANSCLIDLYENNEAVYIRGAYRIQVVDSLSLALPANTTGSPENWTLTGLALVLDPGTATREEPATHYAFRYKRPWGWIGTHWFGFGGWVDGHDVLEIDYGYSCQQYETKLSSIQHSQHNPDSEATTRLDAAKSLGRLYNELYFQEGFTPSWPGTAPQDSSDNKDADDNRVDTSLYWWDLHQSTEAWTLSNLDVALCAGTYNIAAGVPYTMYFYKFPRGRIHGLSMSSSWDVQRETEGVTVEQYIGGAWALVETLTTDEHGRFVTQPLLELGGPYRIANIGLSLLIANREYTSAWARIPPLSAGEPYIDVDECGLTWLVTEQGGALWVYYLDARDVPPRIEVTQPTAGGGYSRPSIAVRGGELLVAATETAAGNTVLWSSLDRGETWAEVATDLGTGITLGTVAVRPGTGEVLLTGIDASDNVVLRMASAVDLPRDDLTAGVDEITITAAVAGARSTCQAHPDGSLIAAVQGSGGVDFYRCRTLTTGFVAV